MQWHNTGAVAATDVSVLDALPAGMTYVPGSARWSEVPALVLTDADPTDAQAGITGQIRFCAYHNSCTGLVEANSDADNSSINQVTAILTDLPAGAAGHLTFSVSIDSGLAAGNIYNTAEVAYSSAATVVRENSNTAVFEIVAARNCLLYTSPSPRDS